MRGKLQLEVKATGGTGATAESVDQPRLEPSSQDVAVGFPVPYPQVRPHKASHLRKGFEVTTFVPMGKQPAPALVVNRMVYMKGVPRESTKRKSTERWYRSVTLDP